MFDDVKDVKFDIQKDDDGNIVKIVAGESTYTSLEDAVKGMAEKDAFINQLKAENSEYRGQLKTFESQSKYFKNIEEMLNKQNKNFKTVDDLDDIDDYSGNEQNKNMLTPDQVKEMIEQSLQSKEQEWGNKTKEQRLAENQKKIRQQLVEYYGDEFAAKKAFEAYSSSDEYDEELSQQLLERAPSTLFSAITARTPKQEGVDFGLSGRNYQSGSSTKSAPGWKHYQKMMRENPKQYWDARTQKEIRERMQRDEKFASEVKNAANTNY